MRRGWLTYAGILVFVAWLAVTLILRFEPTQTRFVIAQVQDNKVLSEPTDTGPRFIYETVFALNDGTAFKLQSPLAPLATSGRVCAQIDKGRLTGTMRYGLVDAINCS